MTSQGWWQALRAFVVLAITIIFSTHLPTWTHAATLHSPFLAIIILIGVSTLLGRLWCRYHGDVSVTLFHLLMRTVSEVFRLKTTVVSKWQHLSMKKDNRKLIRVAVLYYMAQYCIAPSQHFAWLHSLLAYKFLLDVSMTVKREFEKRQQGLVVAGRTPTVSNVQDVGSSQQGQFARPTKVAIAISKGAFAAAVLFYQTFYINVWYVIATLLYFMVTRSYAARPLTQLLETAQFESFEGLEQYYVVGLLGVIEVLFALFFMGWTLVQHQQFLMLVALYTNVYTGGRDVINNAVSTAFAEWTILAHFRRAREDELLHYDDVCAVCLCRMHKARKTPCGHFFHGHCLRRCLKEKANCPICNHKFKLL